MTEAINPNTPVIEESTSEAQAGETVDFNQLDAITDAQIAEERETKAEVRKEAAAKRESKKPVDRDSADGETFESIEAQAEDDTDTDEDATADVEVEAKTGVDEEAVEVKLIKVKNGNEELELGNDTLVPVKVNGERTEVELQELVNNYSGKTNWDKKYNELSTERKTFDENKDFINNKIDKFYTLSTTDPMAAFEYLGQLGGKDPLEFGKQFRVEISKMMEDYNNLDIHGKKEYELNRKLEHFERREKLEKQRSEEERLKAETSTHQQQILENFDLDAEEFSKFERKIIEQNLVKGKPSPEQVVEYQRSTLVAEVLNDLDPSLLNNEEAYNELVEVALKNPKFTRGDIGDIAKEVFSHTKNKAEENLSRKVRKTQAEPRPAKTPTKSTAWSFDHV